MYRRWPSKAELVMAMITELTSAIAFDPSGDPSGDLTEFVAGIAPRASQVTAWWLAG
ncbi:hypothetical protein [Kribbella soli]|uniref:hypothetical protein n=1 Tax=Kribbella soli TaxID=1124743 RepID=UPI00192DD542|nr:hypothetical protein [Kribbella soli]